MTRKCTCKLPSGHGHTAECEMLFPQPIMTDGQRWFEEKKELQAKLKSMEEVYTLNVVKLAEAYQEDLVALRAQVAVLKKGMYTALSALQKIEEAEEFIAEECRDSEMADRSRHLRLLQKHFEAIEEALGDELFQQVWQGRL